MSAEHAIDHEEPEQPLDNIDPEEAGRVIRGFMREHFAMAGEASATTTLGDLDETIVVPPDWSPPSAEAALVVAAWVAYRWWGNCQWMVSADLADVQAAWGAQSRRSRTSAQQSFYADDGGCLLRDHRRAAAVATIIRRHPSAWSDVAALLADPKHETYAARLAAVLDARGPGWRRMPFMLDRHGLLRHMAHRTLGGSDV